MNKLSQMFQVLARSSGIATAPFVAVISAVLVLVVGLNLGATVIEATDSMITASSVSSPLAGTVGTFIPVVFLAGLMGIASVLGVAGVSASGDRFTTMILTVLVAVIGISLAESVVTAAVAIDTAVTAAVNSFALVSTLTPFVPVVYVAGLLTLASLSGLKAYKQGRD